MGWKKLMVQLNLITKKYQKYNFKTIICFPTTNTLKRSVIENLIFFSKNRKIKNHIIKAKKLLKLVKLENFLYKPALTLSGGGEAKISFGKSTNYGSRIFIFR